MTVPSIKQPSAFVPLAMSIAALALIFVYVARFGSVQEATVHHDEGPAARVFQLLMVLQLPIIGFFAVRWLPQAPKRASVILALQTGAWIAAIATIVFLER